MTPRVIALALALAACSDAPGETPTDTPAPSEPTGCVAEGGIWTVQLTPVDAQTASECGGASRQSEDLPGNPMQTAMSEEDCDLGRTAAADGCSVLCTRTANVPGMQVEMLIHHDDPTSLSGYAVITGNGVRCEYDVSYTKS